MKSPTLFFATVVILLILILLDCMPKNMMLNYLLIIIVMKLIRLQILFLELFFIGYYGDTKFKKLFHM